MNGSTGEKYFNRNYTSVEPNKLFSLNDKYVYNRILQKYYQNNNWVYNYLAKHRPEQNGDEQLVVARIISALKFLNETGIKNYKSFISQHPKLNVFFKPYTRSTKKSLVIQTFVNYSIDNISNVRDEHRKTLGLLIDSYSLVSQNLSLFIDNLLLHYEHTLNDQLQTAFKRNRTTWYESLNRLAIESFKYKLLNIAECLQLLHSRQDEDFIINLVKEYYTRKCNNVLNKLNNILTILEGKCERRRRKSKRMVQSSNFPHEVLTAIR